MASKRYREKFTFWLDLHKDDEYVVAEHISELKRTRKFASVIRDGIRLICDLRQGKVDVLFELFPWVKAEFLAGLQQENSSERLLREYLDRIEKELKQQKQVSEPHTFMPLAGLKPLNVPKFAAPIDDDDDDFELTPKANIDIVGNFFNALNSAKRGK